jgi:simple sugar transport system ATP-binding protein
LLIGLHVPTQGAIKLYGQEIRSSTPATLRSVGVALIPQDRQREGLALSLTIEENLLLNAHVLATRTPGTLLRPSALRRFAEEQIAHFAIQTSSPQQPVSALSGGNQQRVVIARELSQNPRGIVAVNPTRGLDVGATCYVHQILRERRDHGAAIILISTDLDEIMALSDSISVLYQGNLLGPVSPTTGREQVGRMMTGAWVPS